MQQEPGGRDRSILASVDPEMRAAFDRAASGVALEPGAVLFA
jgi:hypothetical protein